MNRRHWLLFWTIVSAPGVTAATQGAETVVLRGKQAQVSIAIGGGGIIEFRFLDQQTNPLNWEISDDLGSRQHGQPYLRGHFLCLDRWGAPSASEAKNGVPFHGEAPRIMWQVLSNPQLRADRLVTEMGCRLPLAGMTVKRTMRLDQAEAFLTVTEEVTNTNKLGRVYNMVQHPSIAPPFLDETTLVDTNARSGFVQDETVPKSRESAASWPQLMIDGRAVNLREFKNAGPQVTGSDVTSFVFADESQFGWVTACNPRVGLLIGYLWKTTEYPWLNIWRYRYKGRVTARGLEYGTTGYHQSYPVLVKTGRILNRPLFEYIDAGGTVSKSYAVFLVKIPSDFRGVSRVSSQKGRLVLVERRKQNPRTLTLNVSRGFGE